ncbi:juvenile hormone esterase-like [Ostrinia nubilalis]|uniref:juvenile hormone esterase-like n=1 Tax=Ostrinia nubilalis TaxID=29057 RepID=UPI0030823530
MRARSKWVVLWALWAARLVRQPTPPVRVSGGWLRGSVSPDGSHARYLAIPYATVQQRFQAPGPEPKWNGIFEAIDDHIRCTQSWSLGSNFTSGQEDCLILNVYTPLNVDVEKPLPVMVFIHGGAYLRRSSSRFMYGPDYFINKGVVLVTLNYRLGVLGFLCLGIKEAPGNVGMKDQVAALKWVQRNIRAFGGDPDNVTIFGESAGGASVTLHVLSPMSKGLFHKAIVQSGSSLSEWSFQYEHVRMASLFAKEMGLDSKDPYEIFKFFTNKTLSELVVTMVPRMEGTLRVISAIIFSPCAEQIIEGVEPFLTDLPYNILIEGKYNKVPMMVGSNTEEGLLFAGSDDSEMLKKVDFEKALPKDLSFPSKEVREAIVTKLKKIYGGKNYVSTDSLMYQISKYYGEPFFNYPLIEETNVIMQTSSRPIWHYLFGYDGRRNIAKLSAGLQRMTGATHGDELFYLFSQEIVPNLFETNMIEKMTAMWTNFAKYGDPTPVTSELLPVKWPPVTLMDQRALYIDRDMKTIPLWRAESFVFWRELYAKYRRKLPTRK